MNKTKKKKLTKAQQKKIEMAEWLNDYDMKSFEYSELERVREGFENYMIYSEGLNNINGAYSIVEIDDIDEDYVYLNSETGEQDMGSGHSSRYTSRYKINRKILQSKLSLKDKIDKIVDWDYEENIDEE